MAAGKGLADAIADLAALPEDAIERVVAEDIVVHLQQRLARKPSWTLEEEEFIVIMQGNWTVFGSSRRDRPQRCRGSARRAAAIHRTDEIAGPADVPADIAVRAHIVPAR